MTLSQRNVGKTGFEPDALEVADFVGSLTDELETLAKSAGHISLAAYLRAAAWEARSLTANASANNSADHSSLDEDPASFRKA